MKKAKVVKGRVLRVYPDAKGKPFPLMHPKAAAIYIDVPDYVKVNYVWDGEKYAPLKKVYPKVCYAWNAFTYDEIKAEYLRRKKNAAKAD